MTSIRQKIVMIGAFPPPLHGMSAVNREVRILLAESKVNLQVINISGNSLDRGFQNRGKRFFRVIHGLFQLLLANQLRRQTLYISVSGGLGQIYEILFLCIARMFSMRIFLHHHSSKYLAKARFTSTVLTKVSGKNAVHITQCKGMSSRLRNKYASVNQTIAISNVVYLEKEIAVTKRLSRNRLRTIGFISNIAREKGIFKFLDLVEAIENIGLNIVAKIAGPFQDKEMERRVTGRITKLSTVEYLGPKYGNEKEKFYDSIDVLLFPTLYKNETEGIVNHEAMSHGVPVIAYGRGCIPEFIDEKSGLIIDPEQEFVAPALIQLKIWLDSPGVFHDASVFSRRRYLENRSINERRWQNLIQVILGNESELD